MSPRVKRLTCTDVAKIIDDDVGFKEKLIDRMAHTSGMSHDVLRPALCAAIDQLKVPVPRDAVTYRLSCESCGINRLIETPDWENSGLVVTCCGCGTDMRVHFPKDKTLITCHVCGISTTLERSGLGV